MEPSSLHDVEQVFGGLEDLLAEYAPVACVKPGVVVRALCRSSAEHVFLKMIGDSCPCTICPTVPDEVAITFGLHWCRDVAVHHGFVRPLGWFCTGVAFHRTRPAFISTRTRNFVLVLQDEGIGLAPLMQTYPYPIDSYRVRWLTFRLVNLLVQAFTAIGFTHHDLHSGNLVLGPTPEGESCCAHGALRLVDFGTSDALGLRGGVRPMAKATVKRLRFDLRCVGIVLFHASAKYALQPRHEKDPSALHRRLFAGDPALLGAFCSAMHCDDDPDGHHAGHFLRTILDLDDGSGDTDITDCQRLLSHPFLQPPPPTHRHPHPSLYSHRLACLAQEVGEEALSTSILLEQCMDVERDEEEARRAMMAEEACWADRLLAFAQCRAVRDMEGTQAVPLASSTAPSPPPGSPEPSHQHLTGLSAEQARSLLGSDTATTHFSPGVVALSSPESAVSTSCLGVDGPTQMRVEQHSPQGLDTSTMSSVSTHPCLSPRRHGGSPFSSHSPDSSPPLSRRPKRRRLTGQGSVNVDVAERTSLPRFPAHPTSPLAPLVTATLAPCTPPTHRSHPAPGSLPRSASAQSSGTAETSIWSPTLPDRASRPSLPEGEAPRSLDLSGLPTCVTRLLTSADGDEMPTLSDLEVSCCTEPSLLTLQLPPSPRAQNRLWKKYRSALRRLDLGKAEDTPAMCHRIRQYFEVIDEVDL